MKKSRKRPLRSVAVQSKGTAAKVAAVRIGVNPPRGPRKKRPAKGAAPRLETHKARTVWFQSRAAWPVREAPIRTLVDERARVKAALAPAPVTSQWESVGPTNVGGRMTSVVCHPTQPDRIWAGAAGGGVWRSDDAGKTWRSLWHDQDVLNVGSLAIDPTDPQILYCGTGEANLSADSYPGVGMYQTTDGGETWRLLAESAQTGIPRRIGAIAIDPFDSKHIVIGGVGHSAGQQDPGGLYASFDKGVSWQRHSFVSSNSYWCHSILWHPTKKGLLYATVTEQGSRSGIWNSSDGGKTWMQLTGGLPQPSRFGRTCLAISRSNPDVIYAFASDETSGRADLLLGVFRTSNGGNVWKDVADSQLMKEGQISYGNTIAVHPTNPDHVICGGVDLYLSTNGGKKWTRTTKWDADRGKPNYAHADHHCLLMPASSPGRIYDMNDGGMDVSADGGLNWENRSAGLAATMFYDIDVAQTDSRFFGGGAQDNGTVITSDGKANEYSEILGGDGGWMVIDPQNADHFYASYYNLNIFCWRPGKNPVDASPPAGKAEKDAVWMAYITLDPSNSKRVFTGSSRVWLTQDDAAHWKPVSDNLDNNPISAIEVAPADPKRVYVGTEAGGFFRSTDGGASWSPNLASSVIPGFMITRIETSPRDANVVFVVVANFGHSHIFRSDDGGSTWTDSDGGQLPNVPHHAAVIPPDDPTRIFVANDVGVYVSPDLGKTWQNFTKNLPNVMVIDLVYHQADGTLSAATYGRSIYRIKIR